MNLRRPATAGVFGALLSVAAALTTAPACTTHQCDGAVTDAQDGGVPTVGEMIDENTWESTPLEGPWLNFPGQQTYIFHIPAFARRDLAWFTATLSEAPSPHQTDDTIVPSSGNATEFSFPNASDNSTIVLRSDTCAQYWVRVVVMAVGSSAAPGDARAGDIE